MAYTQRQSQNVGPSGGGVAAFGGGGVDIPGIANIERIKVGGTEQIQGVGRVFRGSAAAEVVTTAGAATLTAAQILSGTIIRDCTGASRTDVLPTAELLVAALAAAFGVAPAIGDCVDCLIINGSDPVTEILTLDAGTGGAFVTEQRAVARTILGTDRALVRLRFTGVAAASEAYVVMF